jgi:peptidoglycan-N-acetylglucosamine deacetylase
MSRRFPHLPRHAPAARTPTRRLTVLAGVGAALAVAAIAVPAVRDSDSPAPSRAATGASTPTPTSAPGSSPTTAVQPAPLDDAGSDRAGGGKVVYLSFDDGPHAHYTAQVLDLLDQYQVKATFFQVGGNIASHPELTRRAHQAGHSIQNHSWSHADMRKLTADELAQEVTSTDEKIKEHTGYTPRCLRPPYGAMNAQVKSLAASQGKKIRLWTIDTEDWRARTADQIAQQVLDSVQPESIVLMHDGGGDRSTTVAALPTIIRSLKDRGFTFSPLWCR